MRIKSFIFKRRNCSHRWAVRPSAAPVSVGTCRLCDQVREFKNCQWAFAGLLPAEPSLPQAFDRAPALVGNR